MLKVDEKMISGNKGLESLFKGDFINTFECFCGLKPKTIKFHRESRNVKEILKETMSDYRNHPSILKFKIRGSQNLSCF